MIAEADVEGLESFFLEVIAKPAKRTKKPIEETKEVELKDDENFLD